jgi:hypothetical protein
MRGDDLQPMPDDEIEQTISISLASDKMLKSIPRLSEHRDPRVRDAMRQTFAKLLVPKLHLCGVRFFQGKGTEWHKTHK